MLCIGIFGGASLVDYYCAMHLWSWVQYIFGVASLVLCIVSYIAHLLYHIVKNQEDMNAFVG